MSHKGDYGTSFHYMYNHHTVTVEQYQGTLMSCHTVNITCYILHDDSTQCAMTNYLKIHMILELHNITIFIVIVILLLDIVLTSIS